MKRCPISYSECPDDGQYSPAGLARLSRGLKRLEAFPFSADQQRKEAVLRAAKISIQGIQPKLSTRLNVKEGRFEIVDRGGRYIIKPQHNLFPALPENEGLTMYLAALCGIDVPVCGLVKSSDGSWSYFVKRFDRTGRSMKLSVEDFSQLAGMSRDTKYDSSMEQLVKLVDNYCTFPAIDKINLLKRCLFNFIIGNEDMHLKNFSVITKNGVVGLAPAYDYLSTTVAFMALGKRLDQIEELALPLQAKKRGLTRKTWMIYFARERLVLTDKVIAKVINELRHAVTFWREAIAHSYIPDDQKSLYTKLIEDRCNLLELS